MPCERHPARVVVKVIEYLLWVRNVWLHARVPPGPCVIMSQDDFDWSRSRLMRVGGMWQKWNYCHWAQIQTGCAGTCLVVMYNLRATLCKAAVWSVRGLAISVRVESGMCTETRVLLAWESVVSMRIVCIVNFQLLHKWAFSVGENRDIQKVTGKGRVNKRWPVEMTNRWTRLGRFCKTNFGTIFGKVLVRFRPVRYLRYLHAL